MKHALQTSFSKTSTNRSISTLAKIFKFALNKGIDMELAMLSPLFVIFFSSVSASQLTKTEDTVSCSGLLPRHIETTLNGILPQAKPAIAFGTPEGLVIEVETKHDLMFRATICLVQPDKMFLNDHTILFGLQ